MPSLRIRIDTQIESSPLNSLQELETCPALELVVLHGHGHLAEAQTRDWQNR